MHKQNQAFIFITYQPKLDICSNRSIKAPIVKTTFSLSNVAVKHGKTKPFYED